jgi:HD-GYP domain-containing protein (c-di-GMP phosphodiesterase class II)
MNSYKVKDIPFPCRFSKIVYLDSQFVIAAPQMLFTLDMVKALQEWGFTEIFSEGEPEEAEDLSGENGLRLLEYDIAAMKALDVVASPQQEYFFLSLWHSIEGIFLQASDKGKLYYDSLVECAKAACDLVRENSRFRMYIPPPVELIKEEDYLVSHTMRSTLIAIIIGITMKLSNRKLIELGVASLVHEVGLMRLPRQLYQGTEELSEQEKQLMRTHPVLGGNFCKANGFPQEIALAVVEHHERENGSGYPHRMTGDRISQYGKILATARTYEAVSSGRPHREASDGHLGTAELLKNEDKQLNDTIVRALVFLLSVNKTVRTSPDNGEPKENNE